MCSFVCKARGTPLSESRILRTSILEQCVFLSNYDRAGFLKLQPGIYCLCNFYCMCTAVAMRTDCSALRFQGVHRWRVPAAAF